MSTVSESEGGAAAYLDRYVRSFSTGAGGSEYYRLAVDAHAPLLLDRMLQLVSDATLPATMRTELIRILGTERFRDDPRVSEALLGLLGADTSHELARPTLRALAVVADASAVSALERYAELVPWSNLPFEFYDTVAELAGSRRNGVLRRLLPRARDEVSRSLILKHVDPADEDGALALFTEAWKLDDEARAAAALRLADFRADVFKGFVREKLAAETHPAVRRNLERAMASQGTIPDFHAMQAAGSPNSDAQVDDPRAWASERGNMGIQWIEATYRTPLRVQTLRIYEVNSAGAVVEVQTVDSRGQRRTVWRGADPTGRPGVFELRISPTSYRVQRVRLVLDTDRRAGWNEIDAIEIVGPDGRAWAVSAVASSRYGP